MNPAAEYLGDSVVILQTIGKSLGAVIVSLSSRIKRAGGDGAKLHQYNESGQNICGSFVGKVTEKAIKMGESNACMRQIGNQMPGLLLSIRKCKPLFIQHRIPPSDADSLTIAKVLYRYTSGAPIICQFRILYFVVVLIFPS